MDKGKMAADEKMDGISDMMDKSSSEGGPIIHEENAVKTPLDHFEEIFVNHYSFLTHHRLY